jgi:hypothetical protein
VQTQGEGTGLVVGRIRRNHGGRCNWRRRRVRASGREGGSGSRDDDVGGGGGGKDGSKGSRKIIMCDCAAIPPKGPAQGSRDQSRAIDAMDGQRARTGDDQGCEGTLQPPHPHGEQTDAESLPGCDAD